MPMIAALSLTVIMLASSAAALPPLREVKEIDNKMLWVAIAIEISDRCDSIKPRTLKGLNFLWSLKAQAGDLGYSDDEIKAYVDSKEEKARIRALGESYVRSQGLDPASDADLCRLGRAEIKKGSQIGAFLRAK